MRGIILLTRTFYTPTSGIIYALRSTKTFPRGLDRRQRRRKLIYLKVRMRFKRNTRAPPPVRRARAIRLKVLGLPHPLRHYRVLRHLHHHLQLL